MPQAELMKKAEGERERELGRARGQAEQIQSIRSWLGTGCPSVFRSRVRRRRKESSRGDFSHLLASFRPSSPHLRTDTFNGNDAGTTSSLGPSSPPALPPPEQRRRRARVRRPLGRQRSPRPDLDRRAAGGVVVLLGCQESAVGSHRSGSRPRARVRSPQLERCVSLFFFILENASEVRTEPTPS